MRQQRVQRRPRKRATRRDFNQATPAPPVRRTAGTEAAETLLARIDQLLIAVPRS